MAKRTVFQRLNTIFGSEGGKQIQNQTNKYSINNDVLIKTQSKEEYDTVKLQQQQNKYLRNVWRKVDGEIFQQSIHYETTRIGSYTDFENMEFYPEIAAALDVMMEEATTTNDKGKILNIYSDSNRIKGILEDLFFNRLDIHVSLPMWTRNTCKYGNNFVFLNIDDEKGVLGAKQLPNFEIERHEGDIINSLLSGRRNIDASDNEENKVKFHWRGKDFTFNSWQIAHFRLLSDDKHLPYGCSVLEKARRIWKLLQLSEDAMLVYRVTRAPERRVYKIFVGNIDEEDVPAYVDEIANRFKRTPITDPKTGQVDLRYNTLPVWKNTPIPLLDGRTITIEELAKEYDNGKENWVYSIQDDTHQVVGGKVAWCGKNYTADRMVKVWLDDDTYIVTAEEHPFVMRDGSKKRADELKENDSLMPFYRDDMFFNSKSNRSKYEKVYNPNSGKYEFTHRLVAKEISKKSITNTTVHHKDFNSKNNEPSNLEWFDYFEHIKYHGELTKKGWAEGRYGKVVDKLIEYNKSEKKREQNRLRGSKEQWNKRFEWYNGSELHKEHNKIRKEAQLKDWSDPVKKEIRSKAMQVKFDEFVWDSVRTNILTKNIFNRKTLLEFLNSEHILNHVISINKNNRLSNQRKISKTAVERLINENGFNTITEYIDATRKNHKVKSIEFIGGDDVYCMTVLGKNGENDRHNFAVLSFDINGEISLSGSFLGNSNEQDYFIPVRDENAPTPIDTLPGASNLDQISDIMYLQRKLFTALRVPKQFLNFDEAQGEGKNLSLQDVRFSRTINRIQQAMLAELNKIAIIHLYLLGFEDDLDNFTLTLNNPSTQAEMLKTEQLQMKMSLFKDAVSDAGNGFAPMSMTRAHREILGWSDDEIKQDLLEQRIEKAASAELENTSNVIKYTGMFDKVDTIYGDIEVARSGSAGGGDSSGDDSGGGGSAGGGGFGGGSLDFGGDEGSEEGADEEFTPEEGGDELGGDEGSEEVFSDEGGEPGELSESIFKKSKLISERIKNKTLVPKNTKTNTNKFDNLIKSVDKSNDKTIMSERIKIYDKSLKVNEDINDIIKDIDRMLDE